VISDRIWARITIAMRDAWIRSAGRLNVPVYRLSRGRLIGKLDRAPILLLTITGRRSGRRRTTPVIYLADGIGWS
jgi:F420H(2)-dependent quinone reductase